MNDVALPNRQLGAFLPGNGVGGAGLHWSGVHFRVDPIELRMRSHYEERYGKHFVPKDMTIQDFGVSYEELEPFFDYAEKVFGTSGQAWTVNGQLVGEGKGGNPYAPDRSHHFPLESQKNTVSAQLFQKAANEVGYKLQPAFNQYFRAVHQPLRRADGAVQLLRFLQWLRLLHVFQSIAQRKHPACAQAGA